MCKTAAITYACKHQLPFRLSTCRGTHGTQDIWKRNPQRASRPACVSATTLSLLCNSLCGNCHLVAFEKDWEAKRTRSQEMINRCNERVHSINIDGTNEDDLEQRARQDLEDTLAAALDADRKLEEEYKSEHFRFTHEYPALPIGKKKKTLVKRERIVGKSPLKHEVCANEIQAEVDSSWDSLDDCGSYSLGTGDDLDIDGLDCQPAEDPMAVTAEEAEQIAAANQGWFNNSDTAVDNSERYLGWGAFEVAEPYSAPDDIRCDDFLLHTRKATLAEEDDEDESADGSETLLRDLTNLSIHRKTSSTIQSPRSSSCAAHSRAENQASFHDQKLRARSAGPAPDRGPRHSSMFDCSAVDDQEITSDYDRINYWDHWQTKTWEDWQLA